MAESAWHRHVLPDGYTPKPEKIDVGVGELAVARAPEILVTAALGSCVGVALWDPFTKNGGLAHIMLPDTDSAASGSGGNRFATTAVPALVDKLVRLGSSDRQLIAKIAGGSAMFSANSSIASIGDRNVEEVKAQLKRVRIPLRAEDTGGRHARTVELELESGTLVVRSYMYGVKEL